MLGIAPKPLRYVGPSADSGFAQPTNVKLSPSISNSLLTVTLSPNSAGRPMWFPFRNPTASDGSVIWRRTHSPISINTVATGATLATANSTPFRFWIVVFDPGDGRIVPALWQSVTGGASPTAIAALAPWLTASTTAITGSATSAGTFYTPSGISLSSKPFAIVGYLEYSSGLGTAGTYSSLPTGMQLYGAGIKLPGDSVQAVQASTSSATTTTSNSFQSTNLTASITPTSAINLVSFQFCGPGQFAANAAFFVSQMHRGSTAVGPVIVGGSSAVGAEIVALSGEWIDNPASASSTTYTLKIKNTDNATSISFPYNLTGGGTAAMRLVEIMC